MATLSTLVGLSVSIPLGAISLAGLSVSGIAMALAKKYQKKLVEVTKLTDIVMSAIAMFEMSMSKVLNDGKIGEWEFSMLQALHLEAIDKLVNVDHKMKAETRTDLQKSLLGQLSNLKKVIRGAS